MDDEVREMKESGEIDWDLSECFDGWEIVDHRIDPYLPDEVSFIKKWCEDMVSAVQIIDPDWILEGMDEYQCMDWLEQMRDRGMTIPKEVTSSDLWDAVEKRREKEKGNDEEAK